MFTPEESAKTVKELTQATLRMNAAARPVPVEEIMRAAEESAREWLDKGLLQPAAVAQPAVKAKEFAEGVHAAKLAATPGALAFSGVAALWNAGVDMLYYDVQALTPQELFKLWGLLLSQGSALIVHPRRDGADGVEVMNGNDFVTAQRNGKSSVDTLAVPGVGSSPIAAAAFARNVADALGKPVAAIVAGFGAADLLADACGGWFVLGANNALLNTAAEVDAMGFRKSAETSNAAGAATVAGSKGSGYYWPSPMNLLLNETNEVNILHDLLSGENSLRLLVGHSKGCLALAFTLNDLAAENARQIPADVQIVTIGCVTYFSPKIRQTQLHQYLGSLDVLGASNSRRHLDHTTLAGKTHGLNSCMRTSVSVAEVLHLANVIH